MKAYEAALEDEMCWLRTYYARNGREYCREGRSLFDDLFICDAIL